MDQSASSVSVISPAVSSMASVTTRLKSDITDRIFETVRRTQVCEMEDLVQACSSYTWNQVFLEVDRLSRTGELRLLPKQGGIYAVTLPAA
ncbi:protein of unknown function [Nitrospira japonica]|uniref:Uncharacterized protein n=1 Tax=Nitrospira japonica TaxID=1325564 RepID=A0A1W1I2S8_9BACT|nr:hypothetical protein [Nitrospira japonica]SLM47310.1 protein of unknown function [Nitrospira japonica]